MNSIERAFQINPMRSLCMTLTLTVGPGEAIHTLRCDDDSLPFVPDQHRIMAAYYGQAQRAMISSLCRLQRLLCIELSQKVKETSEKTGSRPLPPGEHHTRSL